MYVAVVHNLDDPEVLQDLGVPNRELIHERTVRGVAEGLEEAGHEVVLLAGDHRLAGHLAVFLARAEGAGQEAMVFNIAYGVQGRDRYTQVPALLEMLGVPYVGSAPSAHSFALDKAHTKAILRSEGIPTPDYAVLDGPDEALPDVGYPVIVKPRREAGSIGLRLCEDEGALRAALDDLFRRFDQPMLVERYVEGREMYVGVLGDGRELTAFLPVEMVFGEGDHIVHQEDKDSAHDGRPGRGLRLQCPADISSEKSEEARRIAAAAFRAVGCEDLARVDLRMDEDGGIWVLEINSIPGLDDDGPFALGAYEAGHSFPGLLDAIVQTARRRYQKGRRMDLVPHAGGGR